ncbi:hypothetical protein [Streptomyces sp. NPDC058463]|uniref:hypothetical protein n=1 Tax=Streptomyces sp. NPDC058463 TaxID=3346510 RepID=UPI00364A0BAD
MQTSVHLLASTPDQRLPARELMAFTLASHIILVPLGVALPLITLVMHRVGPGSAPYLLPESLTVAEGAGASATLTWLAVVTLVALVVAPAVAFLYWLDTRGELEEPTDADLRQGGEPQGGRAGTT